MSRASIAGLNRRRLRLLLTVFFLALAVPAAILVREAYGQLKWEAFHQNRQQAEDLAARIDGRIGEIVEAEERRGFADYGFLVVLGDPGASYVQRSPLADQPSRDAIPGLVGHFQIDADGRFSTPLLPPAATRAEDFGVSPDERSRRAALETRIVTILAENRLVRTRAPVEPAGLASAPAAASADAPVAAAQAPAPAAAPAEAPRDGPLASAEALLDQVAGSGRSAMEADAPAGEAKREDLAELRQEIDAQSAFDKLASSERARADRDERGANEVETLEFERRSEPDPKGTIARLAEPGGAPRRKARKERSAAFEPSETPAATAPLPESTTTTATGARPPSRPRITTFEAELDPFEFSQLDSGHLVLFRKVWREGKRYIQGVLVEQRPFLESLIEMPFRTTGLARVSDAIVAIGGEEVATYRGGAPQRGLPSTPALSGALLYQTRLAAPLSSLEFLLRINQLPAGPGARVVMWAGAALAVVLCGGFWLAYRLGVGQIELARQQQDFVSAVSHELKTPLTSIRMYGELLREGWATEERRRTYYEYIVDESERLSRLIANVLQLARMTRSEVEPDLRAVRVETLVDGVRSKISTQVERAGFALEIATSEEAARASVRVDTDLFSQIVINLVDNALKFSAQAAHKVIEVRCRLSSDGLVEFAVRDHGPGIARDQMRKIFSLFYRSENELTRETVGTGIGLSLVNQLAQSMGGRVDVVNAEPGAEFRVFLARAPGSHA